MQCDGTRVICISSTVEYLNKEQIFYHTSYIVNLKDLCKEKELAQCIFFRET